MKKIAALFLSLMIISPTVFADDDITVYLNEDELIFEQSPIIQNDSTLVPFRYLKILIWLYSGLVTNSV